MTFPPSMKRIRLELARDHDFPAGSSEHGYDFIAPLDAAGHIDAKEWRAHRDLCRVRRFWAGEKDEIGHLVHKPGGAWAFHYDIHGDADSEETGYRFGAHAFVPGEYVSIKEQDGALRTFRIVRVADVD